jgi:prophage antirepressor-like protein
MTLNTFNLNGHSCRFLAAMDDVWFVTTDANNAFSFKGKNTLIDLKSIRLEELLRDRSSIPDGLRDDTLMISLPNLFEAIGRSSKADLIPLQMMIADSKVKCTPPQRQFEIEVHPPGKNLKRGP